MKEEDKLAIVASQELFPLSSPLKCGEAKRNLGINVIFSKWVGGIVESECTGK